MQYLKKKVAAANRQLLTGKSTQKKSSDSTNCERIQTRVLSEHRTGNDFQKRIQDFFSGGGALVSCSTSPPINHIAFLCRIPVVLENRR